MDLKKTFLKKEFIDLKRLNKIKLNFLKIHCNLVDNKEDDEFLTNVFIKNNISDLIIYENHNNCKRKKILDTNFEYIEVCIKDEDNEDVIMKDLFQISLYIS